MRTPMLITVLLIYIVAMPVGALVATIARPGGNITGMACISSELASATPAGGGARALARKRALKGM
jgi:hypothetical protein